MKKFFVTSDGLFFGSRAQLKLFVTDEGYFSDSRAQLLFFVTSEALFSCSWSQLQIFIDQCSFLFSVKITNFLLPVMVSFRFSVRYLY